MRPGWIARLGGHPYDLAYWERSLKPPFDPVCERMEHAGATIWAVRSAALDRLDSATAVWEQAAVLVGRLNGAMRVQSGAEPLKLETVGRIDETGNIHFHVFMEGKARVRSMLSGTLEVRNPDGSLPPPPPSEPSPAQKWLETSERTDNIAEMLMFTGRSDNWFDIYKAFELAEELAPPVPGKSQRKALYALVGNRREVERLIRTANMGRHARPDDPPDDPMSLEEAQRWLSFVLRVVLNSPRP